MRKFSTFVAAAAAVLLFHSAASAECNYDPNPLFNCTEAATDWLQQSTGNWSDSFEDVIDRVDGVSDVLSECYQCSMDTIESSTDDTSE